MNARRVEITLSQERWEQLEAARGFEPRAAFIKRALYEALEPRHSPEVIAALKGAWDSPALNEQMMEETPILDAVSPQPPTGRGKASRPKVAVPGVMSARELAMERQRKLNEGKS
jgi:hypothetical protein